MQHNPSRRRFIRNVALTSLAISSGSLLMRLGEQKADASGTPAVPVSHLVTANGKTYVVANGQPLLFYGVQLRLDNIIFGNFSPANMALVKACFQYANSVGFKTVIVGIPWNYVESSQGVYSFTPYVSTIIDQANLYGMNVQLNWGGSAVSGFNFAPNYVVNDTTTYPRNPAYTNFLDLSSPNLLAVETAALSALMSFIASYDTNNRVIMIQCENEPDGSGPVVFTWGNLTEMAEIMYAGGQFAAVNNLINTMGSVVHGSPRNVVTRTNIGSWYRALDCFNARSTTGTGVDIFGVNTYSNTPSNLQTTQNTIPVGTPFNVTHQPEGGGQYGNLVNCILSNFAQGGGYGVYEIRTCAPWEAYDLGIFRKTSDPTVWTPRDGTMMVPYNLNGSSSSDGLENSTSQIIAFNQMIYKADKKIAVAVQANCAAFNVGNNAGNWTESQTVAGKSISFQTANGGVGFAVQDHNGDLILMSLTTGNIFTVNSSYVQMYAAPIGYYDSTNSWVEQSQRAFVGNTLTLNATEVAKITPNLAQNYGFEQGLSGWTVTSVSDANACMINTSNPHSGANCMEHYKSAAYKVYTSQTIAVPQTGVYTLNAWVESSGGQNSCIMKATGYGGPDLTVAIPAGLSYVRITISGISVTSGSCTIGFYSDANAGNWIHVDDVSFYVATPSLPSPVTSLTASAN